jgi:hypothetical protein
MSDYIDEFSRVYIQICEEHLARQKILDNLDSIRRLMSSCREFTVFLEMDTGTQRMATRARGRYESNWWVSICSFEGDYLEMLMDVLGKELVEAGLEYSVLEEDDVNRTCFRLIANAKYEGPSK